MKGKEEKKREVVIDSFVGFKSAKSDTNKQVAPFTRIRYKLEMLARQQGCSIDHAVKGLQRVYDDNVRRVAQKVGADDFIAADFSNVDPDNVVDDTLEDVFTCSSVANSVVSKKKKKDDEKVLNEEQGQKVEDNKNVENNTNVIKSDTE